MSVAENYVREGHPTIKELIAEQGAVFSTRPPRTLGPMKSPTNISHYWAAKRSLLFLSFLASVHSCFAEPTKTVACADGRVYRDLRKVHGEEFCERLLPGFLVVKDGP